MRSQRRARVQVHGYYEISWLRNLDAPRREPARVVQKTLPLKASSCSLFRKPHCLCAAGVPNSSMRDLPATYPAQYIPAEERGALPANFFVKRYEDVSGKKFNGWWLHSGLLEIGRVLAKSVAMKILEGCLSPIRVSHLWEDFHTAIKEMEEEQLKSRPPLSIEDVTEAGTIAIALSYKQQHDLKT